MVNLTRNFSEKEFKCSCCGECLVHMELVERLQIVRDIIGEALIITSGYRCPKYNTEIGKKYHSVAGSSHTAGWAVDIKADHSPFRYQLISILLRVGFTRIGIGKTFIHCDLDPNKPQEVIWTY